MPKSNPSRSSRVDDFDETYEITMPLEGTNAKINLLDKEGEVEVIISEIPSPRGYNLISGDKEEIKQRAVARWILEDAARVLDKYDWNTSTHVSRQRNHYLSDVYFTCDRESVNDAVIHAQKFLIKLEENILYQSRKFDTILREPPSEVLDSD